MDFLKKKMQELLDDEDKLKKDNVKSDTPEAAYIGSDRALVGTSHGERSMSDQYGGQGGYPPQPQSYPSQPQSYPQQQSYQPEQQSYPPQNQGYYQHQQPYSTQGPGYYQQQPQQRPYDQGAPVPQGPSAPYGPPPPLPSGWIQQWDQTNQRAYYVEQATGRTQWDLPSNLPPGSYAPPLAGAPYQPQASHDERALFGNTQGHGGQDYAQAPGGYGAYSNDNDKDKEKKDKDKGHSAAMLAAAGIGGIAAGAWIGHELTEDDDDDNKAQQYAAASSTDPYGDAAFAPPPPVPTHDEDGSSISSSDRESMEERREELIEAQEAYQEEIEENYDSD